MANTIKLGNGNWATKEGSLLAYNDENNNFKPLPFTTTRASSATVVNKQGLIETVGSGIPRIDFSDDANGALLLEPSRTNSFQDGENVAQTLGVGNATIVQNNNISPKGDLSAAKFTENTSTSSHFARIGASIVGQVAISMFAKSDGRNRIYLTQDFNNGVIFNLNTGVVDSYKGSGFTGIIEDYGNGWYRCIIYTTIASGGTFYLVTLLDGSDSPTYLGDGASSVLLYGAQLEQGSYATSYIPTSGTTQTRVADTASGSGNSTVINSTEGVLYAEMSALANNSESRIIQINNSSDTSTFALIKYGAPTNRVECQYRTSGYSLQASLFKDLTDSTESIKIAFKWQLNNFALYINGVKISEDLNGNVSPSNTFNNLLFDNFYGKVKSLQVYTTALSDAELTSLTTI